MILMTLFHLGMVNTVYQFKLNISYIENKQFLGAYIMLSIRTIYFEYEIGVLETKIMCVTA